MQTEYCNIGEQEAKSRFRIGVVGLAISIILIVLIFTINLLPIFLFPFAFMSAIGFIQAREKYCVYVGIFDLLKDPKNHKKDLIRIARSVLFAGVIAAILNWLVWWMVM